jgi:UDPglucose 6-dehydrogenase
MEALWAAGCSVRAYDPVAREQTRKIYGDRADLSLCESAEEALEGADALAIATEWREFRSPNFDLMKSKLAEPVIFDGRNLYDPRFMRSIGFQYYGIGRGDSVSVPMQKHERRRSHERRRAQRD